MPSSFAGILLSAGLGRRLRPFTNHLSKPLVTLLNKTPLWHQIMLLRSAGIDKMYVNLHYRYAQMRDYLHRNFNDIEYIYEPIILGTGGGIRNIIRHFGLKVPLVILNSDTVSNLKIKDILEYFIKSESDAVMLLKRDDNIPDANSVFVDSDNMVRFIKTTPPSLSGLRRCKFLGVHILNTNTFRYLPEKGCINEIMYPILINRRMRISGVITRKDSYDIGTPESLYKTNFLFLNQTFYTNIFSRDYIKRIIDTDGNIIGENCKISDSIIVNSIIGETCIIKDSFISDSLIMPFSRLIDRSLKRSVANTKYHYIISKS